MSTRHRFCFSALLFWLCDQNCLKGQILSTPKLWILVQAPLRFCTRQWMLLAVANTFAKVQCPRMCGCEWIAAFTSYRMSHMDVSQRHTSKPLAGICWRSALGALSGSCVILYFCKSPELVACFGTSEFQFIQNTCQFVIVELWKGLLQLPLVNFRRFKHTLRKFFRLNHTFLLHWYLGTFWGPFSHWVGRGSTLVMCAVQKKPEVSFHVCRPLVDWQVFFLHEPPLLAADFLLTNSQNLLVVLRIGTHGSLPVAGQIDLMTTVYDRKMMNVRTRQQFLKTPCLERYFMQFFHTAVLVSDFWDDEGNTLAFVENLLLHFLILIFPSERCSVDFWSKDDVCVGHVCSIFLWVFFEGWVGWGQSCFLLLHRHISRSDNARSLRTLQHQWSRFTHKNNEIYSSLVVCFVGDCDLKCV